MIVLIRFRMHQNHVVDPRLLHEVQIRRQSLSRRLIGGPGMVRKPLGLEKVDMRIHQQFFGAQRGGSAGRRRHGQNFTSVQHRCNYIAPLSRWW